MKAITQDRYGDSSVLHYEDVPEPELTPDRVLVRMRAAGLEMGVWHLMTGKPYFARLFLGLRKPKVRIRGWDYAGVVEAVGSEVSHVKPGDEVFGSTGGSFAELLRPRGSDVTRKPATLSFEEAAGLSTSGYTALQALRDKAAVGPGQRVLIIGAGGGVGHLAVQLAKHYGATVVGVCSTGKVDFVRSLGADAVIDYTIQPLDAEGTGYDAIIDIGGARPVKELLPLLAPAGKVVLVGGEGGGPLLGAASRQFTARSRQVSGLMAEDTQPDRETLAELAGQGVLRPHIDRVMPLAEGAAAIDLMASGAPKGKIVLVP
jgi:NADPH:quinone reductase-like Zn-dependent oxidoreductase